MSYILDALRRADAERERERGGVPGLHSMPIGSAAPTVTARPPWIAAALGAAALSLLGLLGWWLWPMAAGPAPAAAQPAAPTMTLPSSPAVAAAPEASPAAQGLAPVSAPPSVPAPPSRPAPPPAPAPAPTDMPTRTPTQTPTQTPTAPKLSGPEPPPARSALREPPPPALPAVTPARPPAGAVGPADPTAAAPAPASAAFAAPPGRPEDKVIAFEQLPEDLKRSLPPLAIGGAVYSDNPGSRLLMIGGQLLKEGDVAGPGVTLEQIRPRSAVLRWKDVRYEVRF